MFCVLVVRLNRNNGLCYSTELNESWSQKIIADGSFFILDQYTFTLLHQRSCNRLLTQVRLHFKIRNTYKTHKCTWSYKTPPKRPTFLSYLLNNLFVCKLTLHLWPPYEHSSRQRMASESAQRSCAVLSVFDMQGKASYNATAFNKANQNRRSCRQTVQVVCNLVSMHSAGRKFRQDTLRINNALKAQFIRGKITINVLH